MIGSGALRLIIFGLPNIDTPSAVQLNTYYRNSALASNAYYQIVAYQEDVSTDLASIKQVTALGVDALQLRSTASGSTRNWASKEAGFNPNSISKIEVFNAE